MASAGVEKQQDRFRGCLLGLAIGDAVGMPVEFKRRGTFPPLTDMVGGGPFHLAAGQWTDDTSMALCLATSLVEQKGFDAHDQMSRYVRWSSDGYLSSIGRSFGIGNTVRAALQRFQLDGDPYAGSSDVQTAGNGCIMRLAPIPMYFFPDIEAVERYSADSTRTTHGTIECIDASRLFGRMICSALAGSSKDEVLFGVGRSFTGVESIARIARGEYLRKAHPDIRGSGYVVESLEAALWAFAHTHTYEQAVLAAANLGDDADTTAAVCGQLAGAYYGASRIPAQWLAKLTLREEIISLADRLEKRR